MKKKTLKQQAADLSAQLSIDGKHALRKITEKCAVIYVSLYDNESYIRASNGRLISKW